VFLTTDNRQHAVIPASLEGSTSYEPLLYKQRSQPVAPSKACSRIRVAPAAC
jgi:hypothetical protein